MTRKTKHAPAARSAGSTAVGISSAEDPVARYLEQLRKLRSRQFREALSPFWAWRVMYR